MITVGCTVRLHDNGGLRQARETMQQQGMHPLECSLPKRSNSSWLECIEVQAASAALWVQTAAAISSQWDISSSSNQNHHQWSRCVKKEQHSKEARKQDKQQRLQDRKFEFQVEQAICANETRHHGKIMLEAYWSFGPCTRVQFNTAFYAYCGQFVVN